MSQVGAQLQGYNNELVKCIEDLCFKRDELQSQILTEEDEKFKIQTDIHILSERLRVISESLAKKIQARNEYDRTIAETENAYNKILESSQALLHVLKRESATGNTVTDSALVNNAVTATAAISGITTSNKFSSVTSQGRAGDTK